LCGLAALDELQALYCGEEVIRHGELLLIASASSSSPRLHWGGAVLPALLQHEDDSARAGGTARKHLRPPARPHVPAVRRGVTCYCRVGWGRGRRGPGGDTRRYVGAQGKPRKAGVRSCRPLLQDYFFGGM
jgi:hypothetical protein